MSLLHLAETGDTAGVLRWLSTLTPEQRAAHTDELATLAETMDANENDYTDQQHATRLLAEFGCRVTPETAADFLLNRDWRHLRRWHGRDRRRSEDDWRGEFANLHPPDWRTALLTRIEESLRGVPVWDRPHLDWIPLAERIIQDTGGPAPTSDEFLRDWLTYNASHPDLLRENDLAPVVLPRLVRSQSARLINPGIRFGVLVKPLVEFAAQGVLDRETLIHRIFAELAETAETDVVGLTIDDVPSGLKALALSPAEHAAVAEDRVRIMAALLRELRSGHSLRTPNVDGIVVILRALTPTAAEHARLATEHMVLLRTIYRRDASTRVMVGYAQKALLRADEAGLLDPEAVAEAAEQALNSRWWPVDHQAAGLLSRLAGGNAIDRGALIEHIFTYMADMRVPDRYGASGVLTALALTPAEHAAVADERVRQVERALTRLLEEDDHRAVARVPEFLGALAPTAAENARFVKEYVALLDQRSPVAGHAQKALLDVAQEGLLEPETLSAACERLLLRPEKKLVRAQLTGLDRIARRDPTRADRLILDASTAFRNQDSELQKRALDVVSGHLPSAGDAVLAELRTAAEGLSPALSARAAELFGMSSEDTEQFEDVLPAVPEPQPVAGPPASAVELAQEVAAVVAGDPEVAAFERALDGLVRHARSDRTALAEALQSAVRREPTRSGDCQPADLYDVATAVRGDEPRRRAFHVHFDLPEIFALLDIRNRADIFSLHGAMLAARMSEVIDVIDSGTQPFLLAVPSMTTGALDADVLVRRVSELERLGVTPAPVDLAQALLRVTPTSDEHILHAAGELRSEAGRWVARWLREGGLPHQDSEPEGWRSHRAVEAPATPGVSLDPAFPQAAANLVGPYRGNPGWLVDPPAPFWVAQLPHHRDEIMAREYTEGIDTASHRRTRLLPVVAESDGPAGYAVHIALARGTANSTRGDAPTVDALLVLAARGQLDTGLLGGMLERLLRDGTVEAKRVVDSLRTAAETGAYGTVWAILEAALPGLLRDTPIQGAAAFLALAAECVSRCGATGDVAEVTATAQRGGSSQTTKNAKLLRDALR